ncbi:MAG: hypothetical protein HYT43_00380 [Candidatus Taylorbacteria bacterium]|nr:hypothetical protein [Candidatus Taylorbacteria bacterium]
MFERRIKNIWRLIRPFSRDSKEIFPDEIFLDSSNLPQFDIHQFEGRLERPISRFSIIALSAASLAVLLLFTAKLGSLQIVQGGNLRERSLKNTLRYTYIFPERGVITDRRGEILAWNKGSFEKEFSLREYNRSPGHAHVLGYLRYPARDSAGFYWKVSYEGVTGAEKFFSDRLHGRLGKKVIEVDALGEVKSASLVELPGVGADLKLSVDAALEAKLHALISEVADERGFPGGAGVIMDVESGEILAMTSYPEYDPGILTEGKDARAIESYLSDERKPFLNRVTAGLYTPGSIIKPFLALAALSEGIISPSEKILSDGELEIPNPYDQTKVSIFTDWRAHGLVDMRRALAVSSNIYFYVVGGGFEERRGLGIRNIERYMRLFGFGEERQDFFSGEEGVIPNPEWKAERFGGDEWRVGDTYLSAIGQYGFQVTPLQVVRAMAAIANGGKLLKPAILAGEAGAVEAVLPFDPAHLSVVREGLRLAVTSEGGTAAGLNVPYLAVAAKTGTAEIGVSKQTVNSWVTGYFPYGRPRYAFAVVMDRGPRSNRVGSVRVTLDLLDWMAAERTEYLN